MGVGGCQACKDHREGQGQWTEGAWGRKRGEWPGTVGEEDKAEDTLRNKHRKARDTQEKT